jgi:hypothetical protein
MAHSALLVAFLILPAASTERSLGDPAGEPALHRSGPVKGLRAPRRTGVEFVFSTVFFIAWPSQCPRVAVGQVSSLKW